MEKYKAYLILVNEHIYLLDPTLPKYGFNDKLLQQLKEDLEVTDGWVKLKPIMLTKHKPLLDIYNSLEPLKFDTPQSIPTIQQTGVFLNNPTTVPYVFLLAKTSM